MILSYFTVALRNLLRHKLFSAINIGGLAIGLAAFWMIALYIGYELSYDRYQPNADRIFRSHNMLNGMAEHFMVPSLPILMLPR